MVNGIGSRPMLRVDIGVYMYMYVYIYGSIQGPNYEWIHALVAYQKYWP